MWWSRPEPTNDNEEIDPKYFQVTIAMDNAADHYRYTIVLYETEKDFLQKIHVGALFVGFDVVRKLWFNLPLFDYTEFTMKEVDYADISSDRSSDNLSEV